MRVVIFDMVGNVLNKFSCSRYLEFPNGVVVNDSMEIYISDNRAHCVKVFDYSGNYLRQIGGEGGWKTLLFPHLQLVTFLLQSATSLLASVSRLPEKSASRTITTTST